MSSGACRALTGLLLTLVVLTGVALPVAAITDSLKEQSEVTYRVNPNAGAIDVEIDIKLSGTDPNRAARPGVWGPIVVEERATPRIRSAGFAEDSYKDLPGPWKAMYVSYPQIEAGDSETLRIRYRLDASVEDDAIRAATPARVDPGYIYACVPGQDTDSGSTELIITRGGDRFEPDQSGTVLEKSDNGDLQSGVVQQPRELFTCVESAREDRLEKAEFRGPDDRTIILQAWPNLSSWLIQAERFSEPTLREIRSFLDLEIPGENPVVVRQAPPRDIGGYASDHDTVSIVQLDELGGVEAPEHQLAHAWFGTDNILDLWLREGLAEWTASSMAGSVCAPVEANDVGVNLQDWKVVKPFSDPGTIDQEIIDQRAAACGVVAAMASRMSPEQWHEVLGSMLRGETKYNGSSGSSPAATTTVNYQEWLDAVDERGLVPAGNEDLDFAQNLIEAFGAEVDPVLLSERSAARQDYHAFLAEAAPLGAPLAVREAMDDWEFDRATGALVKSREVLSTLKEASDLLPGAAFTLIVQPLFEAAGSEAELDDVLTQALTFRDIALEAAEPLAALVAASPQGWTTLPAAITDAISGQRFDELMAAIPPSLQFVQALSAGNEALPQAGLLDTYQARYEGLATVTGLQELADEVSEVSAQAVATGASLADLEASVGDWQIPAAVAAPIESGQISDGLAIVTDARAVVQAARDADVAVLQAVNDAGIDLPDANLSAGIRARFEAVASAEEMAALRADAEKQRDEAEAIGGALAALNSRAPEWQIPAVISMPIEAGDYATAAEAAAVAQVWIDNAYEANTKLPAMDAINRAQEAFESATKLADLEDGASRAKGWNLAADNVAQAQEAITRPRDLLAELGLWGVDLQPILDEAVEAAIVGDSTTAFNRAAQVIESINGASSSGGLRLAGVVFLGVAIVGVLGLWLMLRREAGPPWARQTKPHWVEDNKDRKLLGRGKSKDAKNKANKVSKPR